MKITFEDANGRLVEVEGTAGESLMRVAVQADVVGIDADCGGACSCATCHVWIADDWLECVGPATERERDMIEFDREPASTSRLSCQVKLTEAMDGLHVRVVPRD